MFPRVSKIASCAGAKKFKKEKKKKNSKKKSNRKIRSPHYFLQRQNSQPRNIHPDGSIPGESVRENNAGVKFSCNYSSTRFARCPVRAATFVPSRERERERERKVGGGANRRRRKKRKETKQKEKGISQRKEIYSSLIDQPSTKAKRRERKEEERKKRGEGREENSSKRRETRSIIRGGKKVENLYGSLGNKMRAPALPRGWGPLDNPYCTPHPLPLPPSLAPLAAAPGRIYSDRPEQFCPGPTAQREISLPLSPAYSLP